MNETEKALRRVRPREPSSSYLDRGLARITAHHVRSKVVSANWRYATIGVTILFAASIVLNVMTRLEEKATDDAGLTFSVLHQEGELLIYETGYVKPDDWGGGE